MAYMRLGAKNLGLLVLPGFCAYCFWLIMQLWHNRAPFRFPPPRLINRLDHLQKRLVLDYWMNDPDGRFPKWLGPFAKEGVDCEADLRISGEYGDLTVTGVLDFCFELLDGTYGIVDGKTAYCNGGEDPLLPLYKVQVSTYAWLLSLMGREATRAGFLYFEGQTDAEHPEKLVTSSGHKLDFQVVLHEVELDWKKSVPALLKRVEELYSLEKPPESNPDCADCAMLAQYNKMRGNKNNITDALSWTSARGPKAAMTVPSTMQLWDWSQS